MKKKPLLVLLIALMTISVVCGCTDSALMQSPNDEQGDRPYMNDFNYDTVDELVSSLISDFPKEVLQDYANHRGDKRGKTFSALVKNLQDGSVPLYIPYYQGQQIEFQNKEGFPNVTLFPSESFDRPWIFYLGDKASISIMYLDKGMETQAKKKGTLWVVEQINSTGTGKSAKPFVTYSETSEKDIMLSDKTVKVAECILKNVYGQFTHTYFVYDDVLVRVNPQPDLPSDWMKDLSFEKIYLND